MLYAVKECERIKRGRIKGIEKANGREQKTTLSAKFEQDVNVMNTVACCLGSSWHKPFYMRDWQRRDYCPRTTKRENGFLTSSDMRIEFRRRCVYLLSPLVFNDAPIHLFSSLALGGLSVSIGKPSSKVKAGGNITLHYLPSRPKRNSSIRSSCVGTIGKSFSNAPR